MTDSVENMSFEDKLKMFQEKTEAMGTKEARIGFFFKNDEAGKEVGLLSETYCACAKNSKPRKYSDGKTSTPGMLATNRAIWHQGVVHWGGPEWHESRTEPGRYAPHGGKDFKPEGNLRDNREPNRSRNIAFNPARPNDAQLLHWGLELFEDAHIRQSSEILLPKVLAPTILCPVPMNRMSWLTLRQGTALDKMTELIVNLRRYRPNDGDVQVGAPIDGMVTRQPGENRYTLHAKDAEGNFEAEIEDPSKALQFYIERTFGAVVRIELFPLFSNPTNVGAGQSLYTPIKEQVGNPSKKFTLGELKKMPCFEALQYIVALSSLIRVGGVAHVDAELAYGDRDPLIQMSYDFPKVQRITNTQDAFKSKGPAHKIDMLDVPHRVHMRKFKEMHEREKQAKLAAKAKAKVVEEPKASM